MIPGESLAQMRPLVRDMLDNLSAIERITEGIALEDWDRIGDSARELRARAVSMRLLDLKTLRMDPAQDPMWDAFLLAQEEASREISTAVRNEDARAVLQSTRKMMGNACLGCHAGFRDLQGGVSDSVLFMTSFLSYWGDINRGLMVRDFRLIGVRARELAALAEVVGTDASLEGNFGLGGPRQRRQFRGYLSVVSTNATALAGAAEVQDVGKILDSFDAMWAEGCVACHEKFRK